jgi:predicted nucleotide-binding protein
MIGHPIDPSILSPIDRALGGQALVGKKTALAVLAYAVLFILQSIGLVGTATGPTATVDGQFLTDLVLSFGALGLLAKIDRVGAAITDPPILSPIDRVLGGQALVGKKTALAVVAYLVLSFLQSRGVVGSATGYTATAEGQIATGLILSFGALGLLAKIDRLIRRNRWHGSQQQERVRPLSSGTGMTVAATRERKIFIVHGHDQGPRDAVARFLERMGFEPIILHEQPNKGRSIIAKFREEASEVGFAVVLMTPDDYGGKEGAPRQPRARQNVVFELGFFYGAFGPERVAALVKGDIEPPSDFEGVLYISLDEKDWQKELARELKAAGFDIDWNKVMR